MEPAPPSRTRSPRTSSVVDHPAHRQAMREAVIGGVAALEPGELRLAGESVDVLIDLSARAETLGPGPETGPSGFGDAAPIVLAIAPIVVRAVANLVRDLGADWLDELRRKKAERREPAPDERFAVSLGEAEIILKTTGLGPDSLARVVAAAHRALLDLATAPRQPADGSRFDELTIRLETELDGGYRSRVAFPAGGGSPTRFRPPFETDELPRIVGNLARAARKGGRNVRPYGGSRFRRTPEELGGGLFEALFGGATRDSYEHQRALARSRDRALRIRLLIDPSSPELSAIPWETLYDRRYGQFLSLDALTPVVRQLDLGAAGDPRTPPVSRPLRLLVGHAVPVDTPPIGAGREIARIEEELAKHAGFRLEVLPAASTRPLRRLLRRFSPHVLHLIAHGAVDVAGSGRDGHLHLSDPDDRSDRVTGEALSVLTSGCRDLRLVVLNACDSGRLARHRGLDAFSCMAAKLVRKGLPAVIAMQLAISDDAAIRFGEALYEALSAGDPLEVAITEGRQAIFDLDRTRGSFEWATPVLYLHAPNGRLFAPADGDVRP